MKLSEAKVQIEKLRREIEEHNHKYYILHQPSISDFDYDILINKLDTLERKFPELIIDD
jgi:DNA ligase (NAD+)